MQSDTRHPRESDAPVGDLPSPGWLPRLARAFMRCVLRRVFRFEIEGLGHIPRGRYIISANHPAYLETFTLVAFVPADRGLRVLASRTATTDIPWRRWILDRVDIVLPVDLEGRESRTSIRTAVNQLRAGGSIAIFPEDIRERRASDAGLRPLRRGVALLARSSQSPVVPVGVSDTRELWLGRTIRVRIGEPIAPPADKREDDAFLARLAAAIEALRPPPEPPPARRHWSWLSRLF
ncbi:MAG: 1-acyl-sn-glycerol-3-phosphate acyltransferase [Chloroflexi bacterium]|nr:1-acyl-sn-glycerol-3-phosphate acyltransferase [Chloroflexota bacterium]